mgnify:FL=1
MKRETILPTCKKCGGANFRPRKRERGRISKYCLDCKTAYNRKWRSENYDRYKESVRRWRRKNLVSIRKSYRANLLKYVHKLTVREYNLMFKNQDYKCAICKEFPSRESLGVDHDHTTGKIRGLLCGNCNRALGLLRENRNVALGLVEYIDKFCWKKYEA